MREFSKQHIPKTYRGSRSEIHDFLSSEIEERDFPPSDRFTPAKLGKLARCYDRISSQRLYLHR